MEIILFVIGGFMVGSIVEALIFAFLHKSVGDLRIYDSDPDDGPYLFLELNKDVETVSKKKYITLKVDISQK